ncbi:response regulator transcription factor [Fontibacillus sp. BL9]|uniref:response regulator transcription factor n=1 Tax=Fontibacillus sp. BL9 TaxID=3389971 RepID=UPI00397846EB
MAIILLNTGLAYLAASIVIKLIDKKSLIYKYFSMFCLGISITFFYYFLRQSHGLIMESLYFIGELLTLSACLLFSKTYCQKSWSINRNTLPFIITIVLASFILFVRNYHLELRFLAAPFYFYSIYILIKTFCSIKGAEKGRFALTSCIIIFPVISFILNPIFMVFKGFTWSCLVSLMLCISSLVIFTFNLNNTGFMNHKVTITVTRINESTPVNLTEREIEILKYIEGGLTNKTVSEHLYLSESTVRNHITNINRKLSTKNKTEALEKAKKLNIV